MLSHSVTQELLTRLAADSLAGIVRLMLGSNGLPPGRMLNSGVAPNIGVGVAATAPLAEAPPAAIAGVGGLLGSSWWQTGMKVALGALQCTQPYSQCRDLEATNNVQQPCATAARH